MITAQVRELCELMHEHGLSILVVGDVRLERPASTIAVKGIEKAGDEDEPEPDDPIAQIRRMTPEQQDAALRLGPTAR